MKTATVRELQHNLARVLHDVEAGEVVEIVRRKTPVARLIPLSPKGDSSHQADWSQHASRMAAVWGEKTLSITDSILGDMRGDR